MDLIIVKNSQQDRYKTIDLEPVESRTLSWGAKGLHIYLISRPPGWKIRKQDLLSRSTDRGSKLSRYIRELKKASLLITTRIKDDAGLFKDWEWKVFECSPKVENQHIGETQRNPPKIEKPIIGSSDDRKNDALNKKHLKTNKKHKKYKKAPDGASIERQHSDWQLAIDAVADVCGLAVNASTIGKITKALSSIWRSTPKPIASTIRKYYGQGYPRTWWYHPDRTDSLKFKNKQAPAPMDIAQTWGKWSLVATPTDDGFDQALLDMVERGAIDVTDITGR